MNAACAGIIAACDGHSFPTGNSISPAAAVFFAAVDRIRHDMFSDGPKPACKLGRFSLASSLHVLAAAHFANLPGVCTVRISHFLQCYTPIFAVANSTTVYPCLPPRAGRNPVLFDLVCPGALQDARYTIWRAANFAGTKDELGSRLEVLTTIRRRHHENDDASLQWLDDCDRHQQLVKGTRWSLGFDRRHDIHCHHHSGRPSTTDQMDQYLDATMLSVTHGDPSTLQQSLVSTLKKVEKTPQSAKLCLVRTVWTNCTKTMDLRGVGRCDLVPLTMRPIISLSLRYHLITSDHTTGYLRHRLLRCNLPTSPSSSSRSYSRHRCTL